MLYASEELTRVLHSTGNLQHVSRAKSFTVSGLHLGFVHCAQHRRTLTYMLCYTQTTRAGLCTNIAMHCPCILLTFRQGKVAYMSAAFVRCACWHAESQLQSGFCLMVASELLHLELLSPSLQPLQQPAEKNNEQTRIPTLSTLQMTGNCSSAQIGLLPGILPAPVAPSCACTCVLCCMLDNYLSLYCLRMPFLACLPSISFLTGYHAEHGR